jgi:glycosyltransferase involved in cell wall biosynthesis
MNPLLSVLMTSYNREQYIGEAIKSVQASTFTDWELIIVDDGSKDNTLAIARGYADKDIRIKVYVNETNLGDYPNRNRVASYAKGKYLKYLDADDIIYPFGLEVMVGYMERFPDAGFGLSFSVIDDVFPYPRLLQSAETIRSEYLKKSYIGVGPSASIIRKSAFDQVGGFSGKQFIGDTELWLKLAAQFPLVLMNPSLNWWRQHPDQQIKLEEKNLDIIIRRLKLSLDHLETNQHFFSQEEYDFSMRRKKQHFSRKILADVFRTGDVKSFFYLFKHSRVGIKSLLSGFQRYL